jgi:carbon-monoxide dehydrogenase medium subunit
LNEAFELLDQHGATAKLLAGGTDLLPQMRIGRARPEVVIDLKRLTDLRSDIVLADSHLRVGALATMTDLVDDERARRHFPALVEAAGVVGSIQIRNRATLSGNICNASPAADTAPALLAYGAIVNLIGAGKRRSVPLTDFFTGPRRTVLHRAELLESIDLPIPPAGTGASFGRVTRRRGVDLATINLCCLVDPTGGARIAFGAVGPRPFVVKEDARDLGGALERAIAHASPISDVRGGADYRRAMLLVMGRRAFAAALEQARSGA